MSAPAFKAMAELAASLHGVTTRSQAAALGISSREINTAKRQGWLYEPTPGALVLTGCRHTWRQDLAVALEAKVSPIWLSRTAIRLHRPGQAGTGALLRALDRWATEGTLPDTWFEELIERLLHDPRIPPLVRQHEIRDEDGRLIARADLAIPAVRLGIEAHSREFHFGPRTATFARPRWELLYLGWFAQRRPAEVAELVAKTCARRAKELLSL